MPDSIIINPGILEDTYLPRLVPYREEQQKYLAECVNPLLSGIYGKNVLMHGSSGIGKTACIRFLFRQLQEESDNVRTIYINCWKQDTSNKIITSLAKESGITFIERKNMDELFTLYIRGLKKPVVVALDEIDKAKDMDFLYRFMEDIKFKTIFMITNISGWISSLDARIYSRLHAERVEFKPYNLDETRGILKERIRYSFVPGSWNKNAFEKVVMKTFNRHDIRFGLHLLKSSGQNADEKNSKQVLDEHVDSVLEKSCF
ncbi:MAG: AAA family ATPase [Candidatus Aenigmarchaeota archaeon]|nr:AAA family ATPase [Candidatus Aenigmarchaeota archaeon]